jgi:hypothetical protein
LSRRASATDQRQRRQGDRQWVWLGLARQAERALQRLPLPARQLIRPIEHRLQQMMQAGERDRRLRGRAGRREHRHPGGLSGLAGRREQCRLTEAGLAAHKQHGFGRIGSQRAGSFGCPAGHLTDQDFDGVKLPLAPVQA